jgi:hypothetical protein
MEEALAGIVKNPPRIAWVDHYEATEKRHLTPLVLGTMPKGFP